MQAVFNVVVGQGGAHFNDFILYVLSIFTYENTIEFVHLVFVCETSKVVPAVR